MIMTQNEAVAKVLTLARNELDYHEKASNASLDSKTANSGSGNWTKYARDLDALGNFYNGPKNGYAWCDVFVDYLFVKSFGADVGRQMIFQPLKSAGAGCLYSAQYYKQANQWFRSPKAGDQAFFSYSAGEYSHTGIVESVSNGTVYIIEGNSSDKVARRSYPLGTVSIVGYGRPKWELASGMPSVSVSDSAAISTKPGVELPSAISNKTDRILKKGTSGSDVKKLQSDLMKLGYNLGPWKDDGDFGSYTYSAVKKFQMDYRVKPIDGEAGPITLAAIEDALRKANKK